MVKVPKVQSSESTKTKAALLVFPIILTFVAHCLIYRKLNKTAYNSPFRVRPFPGPCVCRMLRAPGCPLNKTHKLEKGGVIFEFRDYCLRNLKSSRVQAQQVLIGKSVGDIPPTHPIARLTNQKQRMGCHELLHLCLPIAIIKGEIAWPSYP